MFSSNPDSFLRLFRLSLRNRSRPDFLFRNCNAKGGGRDGLPACAETHVFPLPRPFRDVRRAFSRLSSARCSQTDLQGSPQGMPQVRRGAR